jgi:hypothetical protein
MLLTLEQQQKLVSRGLAIAKTNANLITFKYHRKVMYDYLWKQEPEMLECRGHTYDLNTGKIVLAAPTKTFNYLEDSWWNDVSLDTPVKLYKKFNGFMATVAVHNGEVIVGTTGTTNSNYVSMAKEMIFNDYPEDSIKKWGNGFTWLFEICHVNDPHIVDEKPRAYYLGGRDNMIGDYIPIRNFIEYESSYHQCTLAQALEIIKDCKHEGYMCYTNDGTNRVCKLKSPYYVGKKKLMRAKDSFITELWNEKGLDKLPEMWHPIVSELIRDVWEADWRAMPEQDRRKVLESYE